MIVLGIIILLSLGIGCNNDEKIGFDDRLTVVNNWTDTIDFWPDFAYPDTTIKVGKTGGKMVNPGESKKYIIPGDWEYRINSISSKKLMVFIISVDTLNKYGWDKIASNYNILHRYDLTVDALKNMEWIVPYHK